MSPMVPTSCPLYSARWACDASSMTGMPCLREMSMISSMSHGLPNRWTIRIARVRPVILRSMSSGEMFRVSGSMSANTGIAFWAMMPSTVPTSLTGVVMISSPGFGLIAATAVCTAPLPESVGIAYSMEWRSANALANSLTLNLLRHSLGARSITSIRCFRSSSPNTHIGSKGLVRTGAPPSIASFSVIAFLLFPCPLFSVVSRAQEIISELRALVRTALRQAQGERVFPSVSLSETCRRGL